MANQCRDYSSLVDDNQHLQVQLKHANAARRRAEILNVELQSRVQRAEAAVAQQLRDKEREWMADYDRNVQALLQIVQHHEDERLQLKEDIQRLQEQVAAPPQEIAKITRGTQTDMQRPQKSVPRAANVRFAKEDGEPLSDKDEIVRRCEQNYRKATRMQWLFEQVQCGVASTQKKIELKAVAERLRVRGSEVEGEPQTDAAPKEVVISIVKQTLPTLQQELEERNRVLQERLTTQQNVLDQLLQNKLEHADDDKNPPSLTSCNQKEDLHKHDNPVQTISVSEDENQVLSRSSTQRRPLSPPAA